MMSKNRKSNVIATVLVVFALLGQSMVVAAAPCSDKGAGIGHDESIMMQMDRENMSHDHHQMDDATQDSCCGADPAPCAMNVSFTASLNSGAPAISDSEKSGYLAEYLSSFYYTDLEPLIRPPISS